MQPDYWRDACAQLAKRDPIMGQMIAQRPNAFPVSRGDPFQTLARSVVGQQLSVKAAQTIWNRFAAKAVLMTPARIGKMRVSTLRTCGLSERKAEYLKDLARHFATGAISPDRWKNLEDQAVIDDLVQVRGVGRWTAEMFLIFNLLRPDVYPVDDIGLLNALGHAYNKGTRVSKDHALELGALWQPWRTVATWYLWRSLEPVPVEY
jgi:DNA-3-methyladenine glycosylase II